MVQLVKALATYTPYHQSMHPYMHMHTYVHTHTQMQ